MNVVFFKTSADFSYENIPRKLTEELEQKNAANEKAIQFFASQAPSYRRTILHWMLSAKL